MATELKTAIVLGVAAAVAVAAMSVIFSSFDEQPLPTGDGDTPIDKSRFKQAPDLVGIAHHLNTTHDKLDQDIENSVVLYDIWTYSCINCIRTLPHITAWYDKYSDKGLVIIGIHSPEFEFEKDLKNVEAAVDKYGITYPVVMDNDWETWDAFENRYWPRKYIADHEGYIRYDHIGEGKYKETERVIQNLLKERSAALGMQDASAQPLVNITEFEHTVFRTPEIYLGYKFALGRSQLGSEEGFQPERVVNYAEPDKMELHKFYPIGTWKNTADNMQLESDTGIIKLNYQAKQVNIVTAKSAEIELFLDGMPLPLEYAGTDITGTNKLIINEPGLYNVIDVDDSSSHILELKIDGKGFQVFTFTFG